MSKIFDEVREEGFKMGRLEGIEAGLKTGKLEGIEAGRLEGIEAGKLETSKSTALRMIKSGRIPFEDIAEFSGLTIDEVKILAEEKSA